MNSTILNDESRLVIRELSPISRRSRRQPCLAFKLKLVREALETSIRKVSKKYNFNRKTVSKWVRNLENFKETPNKISRKRLKPKRGPMHPELETRLKEWMDNKISRNDIISFKCLQLEAIRISQSLNLLNREFSCSSGFLRRFLVRNNYSRRRLGSTNKPLSANAPNIIKEFIETCQQHIFLSNLPLSHVIGFDETHLDLDTFENYTYTNKGSKYVIGRTTGNERTRLSFTLCASADGTKLKPYIVIPRKTSMRNYTPPENVIVHYKESGTFDHTVVVDFIKRVIGSHALANGMINPVIIYDQAKPHLKEDVKDTLRQLDMKSILIPERMTSLLQPADVSWIKPIKGMFKQKWLDWMINSEHSFTINGNMKSPGYAKAIQWISECWESLETSIIVKSFEVCGISSNDFTRLHSHLNGYLNYGFEDLIVPVNMNLPEFFEEGVYLEYSEDEESGENEEVTGLSIVYDSISN